MLDANVITLCVTVGVIPSSAPTVNIHLNVSLRLSPSCHEKRRTPIQSLRSMPRYQHQGGLPVTTMTLCSAGASGSLPGSCCCSGSNSLLNQANAVSTSPSHMPKLKRAEERPFLILIFERLSGVKATI
ncbi:hypothetical protein M378DRAFT_640078 [Amanita muscaria Koide BX008]|uniref:Uncharacterized protein n=1 Tax=Amanita muscaria (strain Koide BX008) TaxID=946122 RepID=A0A0C2RY77_AMAMK|nr:hypothetical protein M378DRAFT_640078 [Amanita muscaria Koide BX008]